MTRPGLQLAQTLLADPVAIRAERAKRSFAYFVKRGWEHVAQVEPLVWSWHMDAIAMHAQALAKGEMEWLCVNIPPGHAKSVFTSVLWPAWIWTWWPKCQFIFGSYSYGFVVRDARRCRDLIRSDWYQEWFCKRDGWNLREDFGSADNFTNTAGGVRFATSIGGQGAGLRAHVIGVDDPLNIQDAHSKIEREAALEWVRGTLSQRFIGGYQPKFMLTMQRLHEDDPSAWVASKKGAQVLSLPSEFEPESACRTQRIVTRVNGHVERVVEDFWRDPRAARGELLFPALYPKERIEHDKTTLGPFGFASQHQQRPAPEGGGLFKIENWRFWKSDDATMERLGLVGGSRPRGAYDGPARPLDLDALDEQLISVDATFRETKTGSFVAIHVWGKLGARRMLLYRVKRRMDFTDTVAELLRVIALFPDARRKLIEGKANGDAIISALERSHGISGCIAVSPGTANKSARAHAQQPLQAAGNVELPDGAPWVEDYIAIHAAFPNGREDDDVDAQSQGLQGFEQEQGTADLWAQVDLGIEEGDEWDART